MPVLRRVLGILAGLLTGAILVQSGDTVSALMVHMPKGFNPEDKQALAELMKHVPVSCFLVMLTGYLIGSFAGGLVASLISGRTISRPAMIVGIMLTISGVLNLSMVPHPMWFNIVSTLIYIPAAWCGWRVVSKEVSA